MSSSKRVTALLHAWKGGDADALSELAPLVERQLRACANRLLRGDRAGRSLAPSDLINDAYLRLFGIDRIEWQNERHFVALAASTMRRVLVDRARKKAADKRGGAPMRVTLDEGMVVAEQNLMRVLAVDEALGRLASIRPRSVQIVELRFFGGFTEQEVADALGLAEVTVRREWRIAKAYLAQELRSS